MTDNLPATAEPEQEDAYTLLSRPTLELTDAQIERIVEDLRNKRARFVLDPKKNADRPKAKRAVESKTSKEAKERNTAVLLGQLNLGNLKLPGA